MYELLMNGFPGRASRGFLGWSAVILLQTRDGPVLFDTGGAGDRPFLLDRLHQRGISPDRIGTVILSHLHFDHVGNVECFPNATVIVHEDEIAYFRQYGHADVAMPLYQVQALLDRENVSLVTGEPELFPGVRLIKTPGHTAGHCSLLLTDGGRRIVLAQDAIKHRGEIASRTATGAFSPSQASDSIAKILSLADVIVPGHDGSLEMRESKVVAAGPVSETITITFDGRPIQLDANSDLHHAG